MGGFFDGRLLKTERSYNYKLAATWVTPEVIRATVRLLQLRSRLSNDETRALVAEAEGIAGTVVMVEIDPREGSGMIPSDWEAFLQPKGGPRRLAPASLRAVASTEPHPPQRRSPWSVRLAAGQWGAARAAVPAPSTTATSRRCA